MSGDEAFEGYQTIPSKMNDFAGEGFYGEGQKSVPGTPPFLNAGAKDEPPF